MKDYDIVRRLFLYDEHTGKFFRIAKLSWKNNLYKVKKKEIISKNAYGYIEVSFNSKPCAVHRLIYLYMTGFYPEHDIDHIDGDRTNNKWENLRSVERKENLKNLGLRFDNTTGFTGVSFRKDISKYETYINLDGVKVRIGNFVNLEDAVRARLKAEEKYKFHKNHGKREAWRSN